MDKKIRILVLTPYLPYPLNDGLKLRAFHTLKQLLNRGYEVKLLSFVEDGYREDVQGLRKALDIEVDGIQLKKSAYLFSHVFYSLFSKYPFYMRYMQDDEFKAKLESLIQSDSFDLLYVYDRSLVLYGMDVYIPKILDSVDSQSLNSLSGFESSENILHKIFWYISYKKSKKLEKTLYNAYGYVITAAERDAEQLRTLTNSEVVNISNGVDLDYFKPAGLEKIPYSLTFLGTMDAFSNQRAVLYFVEEVYPTIKKTIPDIKLFVIGKDPPQEILQLDDGVNIFVMGYVENVQSCLDKSELIVSPLKMASGIQNKILVAMAMNKAIVATKESLGELNKVITSKDIVVADDSQKFAEEIIKLLSNRSLLGEVGTNGRSIIEKNYSWEALGYKIDELIKNVLD